MERMINIKKTWGRAEDVKRKIQFAHTQMHTQTKVLGNT